MIEATEIGRFDAIVQVITYIGSPVSNSQQLNKIISAKALRNDQIP